MATLTWEETFEPPHSRTICGLLEQVKRLLPQAKWAEPYAKPGKILGEAQHSMRQIMAEAHGS
eukprot:scaffold485307_cov48-Prasinocladus_malaysianus.AAC.1